MSNLVNDYVNVKGKPRYINKKEKYVNELNEEADYTDPYLSKKRMKIPEPTIEWRYINRSNGKCGLYVDQFKMKSETIYKWNGEYWELQEEKVLKQEITSWLAQYHKDKLSNNNVKSIYEVFSNTVKPFTVYKSDLLIIPTKKHWLQICMTTGEITAIPPNREVSMTYQINMEVEAPGRYTPSSTPLNSKFRAFIKSSLPDDATRKSVQQFSGLSLTDSTKKQIMLFFVGSGANGKSTFMSLLHKAHSKPVSTRLDDIGKYNDNLIGASLIYTTETNKKGFDQEFLKAAVSGDEVEVRGIYGKKQTVKITAKWIALMNTLPRIDDFSEGLFRRIKIIQWKQSFESSEKKVEDLAEEIYKTEFKVFVDWCLKGLQDLIKNNWRFEESSDSINAMSEYKMSSDKIRLYVMEKNLVYDDNKAVKTDKQVIFDSFNAWASINNFETMSSTSFWQRIKNLFPKMNSDSPDMKSNGKRVVHLYFNK